MVYVCVHTTEFSNALRWKGILTHATTWMNLEDVMLSDIGPSQRQVLYDSTNLSGVGKVVETENRMVVAGRWGRRDGGSLFNRDRFSVLQDETSSGGGLRNNVDIFHTNELYA